MARYTVTAAVALSAATAKTAVRINLGSLRKGVLKRVSVTDKLAASTDAGIDMRVMTAGTDGTGTGATPNPLGGASAANATAKINYTIEPTGSPVEVFKDACPAGATREWDFEQLDRYIEVAASGALAIELTAAQLRGASGVVVVLEYEEK